MVGRLLVEAEAGHIGADAGAVVLLLAVTAARVQLGRLLLSAQDGDAVVAAVRALLAVEHGAAVAVVVVQGRGTQGVGGADPLRDATAHDRLVPIGDEHVRAADLHLALRLLAELVCADARHEVLTLLSGSEGNEGVLAGLGARGRGPVEHPRAAHDVVL